MDVRVGPKEGCCSFTSGSATRWTAAPQASLSFTISQSLLKLMSIEFMMTPNRLVLCHPLLLLLPPAPGGQSIGASGLASVLPMNIQGWFPFGLTGLISLPSRGFSRVFSDTTVQKHHFYLRFYVIKSVFAISFAFVVYKVTRDEFFFCLPGGGACESGTAWWVVCVGIAP